MRLFLFTISVLFISGCNNNSLTKEQIKLREKEIELKEKELLLREKEIDNQSNSYKDNIRNSIDFNSLIKDTIAKKTKYLFTEIITYEPEIKQREIVKESGSKYSAGVIPDPLPEYEKYTLPRYQKYFSDIIEIENYTEDRKYQEIDKFEKEISHSLEQINANLYMNNNNGSGKPAYDVKATIVSKEAFTFDNYKSASQKRN